MTQEADRYDLIAYRILGTPKKIDRISPYNLSLLYFPILPQGITLEIKQ